MSFKQRLYPAPEQLPGLMMHVAHARFLYNIGLEQRSMWREDRRYSSHKINFATQCRELTELRAYLPWLKEGSTVVQQGALRDLNRAFTNFFEGRASYPSFKSSNDRGGGFTIRDLTLERINRKWALITVPKIGKIKFRLTYPWHEITAGTSARITLRNNQWGVSITSAPTREPRQSTGKALGIDRGVANTIATSDGSFEHIPQLSPGEQKRFLALQQRLSRQVKGSKRRQHTLDAMAVLRRKQSNRRTDWIEQTTTALAAAYDTVVLEDLRITNMVVKPKPRKDPTQAKAWLPNGAYAKAKLNKLIHASCWGAFRTRLEHKTTVLLVSPHNTSRECRNCGTAAPENRESQAEFKCVNCGHIDHADTNAAKNILHRGLKHLAQGHLGDRTQLPEKATVSTSLSQAAQAA